MNELTIKELIASGQKAIPFSEEVLQFLSKKYPDKTIMRWKQKKAIPLIQFGKMTKLNNNFSDYIKKISKEGFRIAAVFSLCNYTRSQYISYFQGITIPPEILNNIKSKIDLIKNQILSINNATDVIKVIPFFLVKKLNLSSTDQRRVSYLLKTGKIDPEALSNIINALKQKAELL